MNNIQLDSDLLPVYTEVMAATRPEDVFGENQSWSEIKARFKALSEVLNPERYTSIIDANAATDARRELTRLYRQVSSAGTRTVLETLQIGDSTYLVTELVAEGDHSLVYRARRSAPDGSSDVVMKIARDSQQSAKLHHEASMLRFFQSTHDRHPIAKMRRTLPELIDNCTVGEKEVLVLPYYHEHRSVADILQHFDHQIPVGHAAWIARRVLALPITAAIAGVDFKADILEHVLVHPITHEPIYLGWSDSVPTRSWDGYPALINASVTIHAVQSLFQNTDGRPNPDVPTEITAYLAEHDALYMDIPAVLTKFTEIVYATLGKKYRPLTLN